MTNILGLFQINMRVVQLRRSRVVKLCVLGLLALGLLLLLIKQSSWADSRSSLTGSQLPRQLKSGQLNSAVTHSAGREVRCSIEIIAVTTQTP